MFNLQQAWDDTITRNAEALKLIIGPYLVLLKAYGGLDAVRIPKTLHVKILQVLRPAETALRRLIVIAARNVVAEDTPPRPKQDAKQRSTAQKRQGRKRMLFRLYDRRGPITIEDASRSRRQPRVLPRIRVIDAPSPFSQFQQRFPDAPKPPPDPGIGAQRLCLRLQAFTSALENIPQQAKRLARWRLQRRKRKHDPFIFSEPLRPGRPPGYKKRPVRDIEFVLNECHDRARAVMMEAARPRPDTS